MMTCESTVRGTPTPQGKQERKLRMLVSEKTAETRRCQTGHLLRGEAAHERKLWRWLCTGSCQLRRQLLRVLLLNELHMR